ncbi:uncharacterized protein LOC135214087 [Macrobrachium nipponense]|uniref:uncharacterized protein LOC135214087 n=1 Tax=Macrobrachium nipponense TaxID=159736 RepID=UPI0030C85616
MMHLSTQALFALLAVSLTYTFLLKDQRYPSYILTANTPCIANGSFRHPSNCSWFYKCQNKMVKGYYQKQFFECAPGTVFDDTLDICIPKSAGGQACGHVPTEERHNCSQPSPHLEGYCYPNVPCNGTKTTSGMCLYRVVCRVEKEIFYCDMNMLNAGLPCTNNSNAVCEHFMKQPIRF